MEDNQWTRPESIPFPKIWRRFHGKEKMANGKVPRFRIQDVTEEIADEVVELMSTDYLKETPISSIMRVWEDVEFIANLKILLRQLLKNKLSMVVLLEDNEGNTSNVIVGVHLISVKSKNEQHSISSMIFELFCKKIPAVGLLKELCHVDVFEKYKVNRILTNEGVSVAREFRGQGIALELGKAGIDLQKAIGINVSTLMCTAIESQILAERMGCEMLCEIPYKEVVVDGEVVFNMMDVPSFKYYAYVL